MSNNKEAIQDAIQILDDASVVLRRGRWITGKRSSLTPGSVRIPFVSGYCAIGAIEASKTHRTIDESRRAPAKKALTASITGGLARLIQWNDTCAYDKKSVLKVFVRMRAELERRLAELEEQERLKTLSIDPIYILPDKNKQLSLSR